MAEVECRAGEKTRAFYIRVFLPWAKEHRLSTNPRYVAHWPTRSDSPEKCCLCRWRRKTGPTGGTTNKQYDWIVLNSLTKNHQSEKAIELAQRCWSRQSELEEKTRLYRFRGTAYGDGESTMRRLPISPRPSGSTRRTPEA